jgi:hypothetical protein
VKLYFSIVVVWLIQSVSLEVIVFLELLCWRCGAYIHIYGLAVERRVGARSLMMLLPLSASRKLTKPNDAIVVTSGYRRGAGVINLPELYTGIELACQF